MDESLLTLILLAFALGIDDLAAAFAFGAKGTKISVITRVFICAASMIVFGGALMFGNTLASILPYHLAEIIGIVLMTVILILIAQDIFRPKQRRKNRYQKKSNKIGKALAVFHNPLFGGRGKRISIGGALLLGSALSVDSVGVGIGFAMTSPIPPIGIVLAGIAQFLMFSIGLTLGHGLHRSNFKHGEKLHLISCLVILGIIIWRIIGIIP